MKKKTLIALITAAVMSTFSGLTAYASGDVAGAVEGTWTTARAQVVSVVDNVIFPVIDVILTVLLFVKISMAYMGISQTWSIGMDANCNNFRLFDLYSDRSAVYLVNCLKEEFVHEKAYLAILSAAIVMTVTACGTISPPVQTPPETAVTGKRFEPTAEPTVPTETVERSEEEQIKSNTFIAEFFDSNIMFTDVQKTLTDDSLKDCSFEKQAESSNSIQKISLKSANGGGVLNVMCIDLSQKQYQLRP